MAGQSAHLPTSVEETLTLLRNGNYLANRSLATALFLALKLNRPLFLEGEAGVGKTEIAKVLSATLGRKLLRLQCYEGLDVTTAVYEWNYSRQMVEIRMAEATGAGDKDALESNLFSDAFLIKRGFGELFRMLSYEKIGTSTIQSRATAGVAGGTYLFALPGSPSACRDAWDDILVHQLDYRFKPCNFVELMPRLMEK